MVRVPTASRPCSKRATCAAARARGAAPDVRAGAQPGAYRPATAQPAAYRSAQPAQRRSAGGGGYPYSTATDLSAARFRTASEEERAVARGVLDRARGVRRGAGPRSVPSASVTGRVSKPITMVAREGFTPPDDLSATSLADFTVDWDALKAINPDTVGWIYIPGTVVNYPIVQAADDEKYLTHDFKGSEGWIATFGAIFLAAENSSDFSDPNNIIYGHHLNDGSMFACVARFQRCRPVNDHRIGVHPHA